MQLEFSCPNRTKLKEHDDASQCKIAILERCPHQSLPPLHITKPKSTMNFIILLPIEKTIYSIIYVTNGSCRRPKMSKVYWPDLKNRLPFETHPGVFSIQIVLLRSARSEPRPLFKGLLESVTYHTYFKMVMVSKFTFILFFLEFSVFSNTILIQSIFQSFQ